MSWSIKDSNGCVQWTWALPILEPKVKTRCLCMTACVSLLKPTCVHKQIAALLHTRSVHGHARIQAGTCDCGLFAIATAKAELNLGPAHSCKQKWGSIYMMDSSREGFFPMLKKRPAGEIYRNNFSALSMQDGGSTRLRYGRELCLEWCDIDCACTCNWASTYSSIGQFKCILVLRCL